MSSRVSVVVTCHNYGRYLRECLESILAQDRPADEIIVVDDASTDDTPAIAAEYAPFGVTYERVEYHNACRSYNHGIGAASGDLIAYVDADNALTPRFIATLAARLENAPDLAFAYSDRYLMGEATVAAWVEIGVHPGDIGRSYPPDPAMLVHRNFIDTMALVRREVAAEVGGFRTLPILWDYHFWIKILEAGYGGGYVAEPLYHYRLHASNMILATRPQQRGCLLVICREHFSKPFWRPYTHPEVTIRHEYTPSRSVPGGVPGYLTVTPEVVGSAFPAGVTLTVALPPGVEILDSACDRLEALLTITGRTLVATIPYPVPDGVATRHAPILTLTIVQRVAEVAPITLTVAWEDRFEGHHQATAHRALPSQPIPAPYQQPLGRGALQTVMGQFGPDELVNVWAALPPGAARTSVALPIAKADSTGTVRLDTRLAPRDLTAIVAQGKSAGNQAVLVPTRASLLPAAALKGRGRELGRGARARLRQARAALKF